MSFFVRKRVGMLLVVLTLAAVLVALAILQYRWSGEVSVATTQRMQGALQISLGNFRQDLSRELAAICLELNSVRSLRDAGEISPHLEHWRLTASHPGLISDLYVWKVAPTQNDELLRLNTKTGKLERSEWPTQYQHLHQQVQTMSAGIVTEFRGFGAMERPHMAGPPRELGPPEFHVEAPWLFDQSIPALLHPIHEVHSNKDEIGVPATGWIVIVLNEPVLQQHILPELAQHHFGASDGLTYKVAVVDEDTDKVIYSSDAGFGKGSDVEADARLNLFGPPIPPGKPGVGGAFFIGGSISARTKAPEAGLRVRTDPRMMHIEPMHFVPQQGNWQLIVKHRKGSVEAAVASLRRRNLTVSFGTLLVLAATMALVIITTHRARRLAQLQMEFVAGVSHELRTPLAVISSAAENIADGVVINEQQLTCYGDVIRNQAKHLSQLVEQVLLFAATQHSKPRYQLRSLQVSDVVDAALESTNDQIKRAGITVECSIEPNLPAISADLTAVSQCLQNLIINAVKYGGANRWIGIHASAPDQSSAVPEVRITIEDKGIGIDDQSMRHIFEPFYRSPFVAGSQIRGTGLGLPLAKSMVEAMGGKLTVVSEAGKGTAFTVHLPAMVKTDVACESVVKIAANPKFSS